MVFFRSLSLFLPSTHTHVQSCTLIHHTNTHSQSYTHAHTSRKHTRTLHSEKNESAQVRAVGDNLLITSSNRASLEMFIRLSLALKCFNQCFFLLSGAINCRAFNRDKGDLGSERGFGAFFEREGQWVYKKRKRFDKAGLRTAA